LISAELLRRLSSDWPKSIRRMLYGYAKAGEEVYHLLPEAQDPVRVPDAWPFEGLGSSLTR